MGTLRILFALLGRLWRTGNFWARIGLTILVSWAVVIPVVAIFGYPVLTAMFTLVVLLAATMLFVAYVDPLIVGVLAAFPGTRQAMRWLATVVGIELGLGVYCSIVPVWKDPELLVIATLVAVTLFFLAIGAGGGIRTLGMATLVVVLLGATVMFFGGGRTAVANQMEHATARITPKPEVHEIVKGEWRMVVLSPHHHFNFTSAEAFLLRPGVSGTPVRIEPDGKMWIERTGEGMQRFGDSVSNTFYLRLPADYCGREPVQVGLTTWPM